MSSLSCESCWWYGQDRDGGSCRRNAPQAGNGWPLVRQTDWCGDWRGHDGTDWWSWQLRRSQQAVQNVMRDGFKVSPSGGNLHSAKGSNG